MSFYDRLRSGYIRGGALDALTRTSRVSLAEVLRASDIGDDEAVYGVFRRVTSGETFRVEDAARLRALRVYARRFVDLVHGFARWSAVIPPGHRLRGVATRDARTGEVGGLVARLTFGAMRRAGFHWPPAVYELLAATLPYSSGGLIDGWNFVTVKVSPDPEFVRNTRESLFRKAMASREVGRFYERLDLLPASEGFERSVLPAFDKAPPPSPLGATPPQGGRDVQGAVKAVELWAKGYAETACAVWKQRLHQLDADTPAMLASACAQGISLRQQVNRQMRNMVQGYEGTALLGPEADLISAVVRAMDYFRRWVAGQRGTREVAADVMDMVKEEGFEERKEKVLAARTAIVKMQATLSALSTLPGGDDDRPGESVDSVARSLEAHAERLAGLGARFKEASEEYTKARGDDEPLRKVANAVMRNRSVLPDGMRRELSAAAAGVGAYPQNEFLEVARIIEDVEGKTRTTLGEVKRLLEQRGLLARLSQDRRVYVGTGAFLQRVLEAVDDALQLPVPTPVVSVPEQ